MSAEHRFSAFSFKCEIIELEVFEFNGQNIEPEVFEFNHQNIKGRKLGLYNIYTNSNLQDIYKFQHEAIGDMHNKKRHKIDHMMISPTLLSIMIHSSFLQRGNIIESDNTLGFVDFDSRVLFGEELPDLTYTATCKIYTKHPKIMVKYRKDAKEDFTTRNLFTGLGKVAQKIS